MDGPHQKNDKGKWVRHGGASLHGEDQQKQRALKVPWSLVARLEHNEHLGLPEDSDELRQSLQEINRGLTH